MEHTHLRPIIHGLAEPAEDAYTRWLHGVLPLTVQAGIREFAFRNLFDYGAVVLGAQVAVTNPNKFFRFVSLGAMRRIYQYGSTKSHNIHVFGDVNSTTGETSKSILVFVHGGAWGSGRPWMYRLVADGISTQIDASCVILIEYPVYPASTILEQRDSILDALRYIRQHISTPNAATAAKIVLCGHSSGANICALALLLHASAGASHHIVDAFIGLSGVFDIEKHYLWEKSRGVHIISPMGAAAKNPELASPTLLAQQWSGERPLGFPTTLLLHGASDVTVPVTSSVEFATILRRHSVVLKTSFLNNFGHADPLMDMMKNGPSPTSVHISQFWRWYISGTNSAASSGHLSRL